MRTAETADLDLSFDLDVIRETLREHPVQLAILFGSYATGTANATSDVDIAVEFDARRPTDPEYNDAFLGLSADLSDALGTNDVDLVDLRSASPAVAESIFSDGVLLVGTEEHAAELRQQRTTTDAETQSPRERIDTALARIDAHLDDGDDGVPATGERERNG